MQVIKKTSLLLFMLAFSTTALAGFWASTTAATHPGVILQVQKRLSELGYLDQKPDGFWGKKTSNAFKKFSESRQLQFDISKANTLTFAEIVTKEHIKALWNIDFDPNDPAQQKDGINFLKKIGVSLY